MDGDVLQAGQLERELAVVRHVLHAQALERRRERLGEHERAEGDIHELELSQLRQVALEGHAEVVVVKPCARGDSERLDRGGKGVDLCLEARARCKRHRPGVDAALVRFGHRRRRVHAGVAPLGALDVGLAEAVGGPACLALPWRHDIVLLLASRTAVRSAQAVRPAHHAQLLAQVRGMGHSTLAAGRTRLLAARAGEEAAHDPRHVGAQTVGEHLDRAVCAVLDIRPLDRHSLTAVCQLHSKASAGHTVFGDCGSLPVQVHPPLEPFESHRRANLECPRCPLRHEIVLGLGTACDHVCGSVVISLGCSLSCNEVGEQDVDVASRICAALCRGGYLRLLLGHGDLSFGRVQRNDRSFSAAAALRALLSLRGWQLGGRVGGWTG